MAQAAARRPVPRADLLPPQKPGPREQLRVAVVERRRLQERSTRLCEAIAEAREHSLDAIGVVDDCEIALTKAERGEQHRAVALALGEEAPPGPSVEEARAALTEAQRKHRLAREAIATLETGLRDLAPQLTFAGARVRDAVVVVFEDEDAVEQLLAAYDACRVRTEQVAAALRFLEPSFVRPGWAHPDRALPPHRTPLVDAWRTVLKALEEGAVETPLPFPEPS
jgi:hypothetical protein